MTRKREYWYDEAAGPLVRPYAIVRGRTSNADRRDLDVITVVGRIGQVAQLRRTEPEYAAILHACEIPISVAEVAAALQLPLLVTKILLNDLIDDGLLEFREPLHLDGNSRSDLDLMRAVLDGIRKS
ncbi:MAG: DUF742 domain-containing protein [Mycobacteriaceae bacterium]|nr:DUF742 domain-containing protein [Mycobacteriaceae bacterium]